ncbi:MAG: tetratricopeptide repeat protein [Candidatus Krumholzibacteriia bacterium]
MILGHHSKYLAAVALVAALAQACALGGNRDATLRQVDAAVARGDTSRAVQLLRGVVRSATAPPERYVQMGQLYRSRNTIVDRLRAQDTLERGLRLFPEHSGILMELGKTYYLQTFFPDAERCFRRVIEKHPGHCEAHYYLGLNWFRKWRHIQVYREYIEAARSHLRRTAECDSTNRDALYKVAFSNYVLGDSAAAIRSCETMMVRYGDAPEASFLRGAIAFEHGEFEKSAGWFNTALRLLSGEQREAFADIGLLLGKEQQAEYELATQPKRSSMQRVFWAEHNPDPTAPVNVRYLEHMYRMALADAFYKLEQPPLRGWETERGKALVKFGKPATVGTTLEGEFLDGRKEIWKYGGHLHGFTFVFMDEFLNGNYMVPIDYRYSYIAQALNLDEPVSTWESPLAPVSGVMDVLAFRNPRLTSVYVALKLDMDSVEYYMNLSGAHAFVTRTSFYDRDWRQTLHDEDSLAIDPVRRRSHAGDRWYYLVKNYDVPFDRHRVAFSVTDDTRRGQFLAQSETNTLTYLSDSLALSDILLYRNPAREDSGGYPATILRGEQRFHPNPGGAYTRPENLRLYVEIYNLLLPPGGAQYEVSYSIFDAAAHSPQGWSRIKRGLKSMMGFRPESDPVISQTLERRSFRHEASENLAIDIDALRAGEYVLTITVRDRHSGEAVERSTSFTWETPAGNDR